MTANPSGTIAGSVSVALTDCLGHASPLASTTAGFTAHLPLTFALLPLRARACCSGMRDEDKVVYSMVTAAAATATDTGGSPADAAALSGLHAAEGSAQSLPVDDGATLRG